MLMFVCTEQLDAAQAVFDEAKGRSDGEQRADTRPLAVAEDILPCLLVQCGSGVGYLKVITWSVLRREQGDGEEGGTDDI